MRPAWLLPAFVAVAACAPSPAPPDAPSAPAPTADATPPATASTPPVPRVDDARSAADTARPGRARMDGYGALRLGMTAAQAAAAGGVELDGPAPAADACVYLAPARETATGDVDLMFEAGRFVRYDVDTPGETAPGGGRAGMTRARIEALYPGRVQVQLHDYVPGGNYLRVTEPGVAGRAMLFETDADGVVTRWRVGLTPQVDYTEGCS